MFELIAALVGMYLTVAAAGIWMRSRRRRLTAAESPTQRGGID